MDLKETLVEKNYVFEGRVIKVCNDTYKLPNGENAKREIVEHNGGVCVVALTDKDEVLFVRQFRCPYGEILLEIPAGKLEKGEDPFESGKRELKEETGATAENYIDLGKFYPSPGYCGETISMYYATGLSFGEQNLDDDEFLKVEKIPLEKAVEMILNGEIRDGKTQAAILKVAQIKAKK
ncbi:MAG: NUDIX hydrolase [Clostridiales bacterium]|nr:NUDIX hydrolase [Clostridiales bacterium]